MTRCLEEGDRHTHWMVFREESPTTSPYWLSLNIYPVLWLDLLVLIQVRYIHYSLYHFSSFNLLGVQLVVKTSPQSLPVGNHNQSLTCTVTVEVNGEINRQPITIHWTVHNGTITEPRMLKDCTTREVTAPIREVTAPISCVVNINKTGGAIYYRCTAKYLGLSNFSDITVNQEGQGQF